MKVNHRNMVRQVVPLYNEDGIKTGEKAIFHEKKFNQPQYGSHTIWWKQMNMAKRKKP